MFEISVFEKALNLYGSGSIFIVNKEVPNLLPLDNVEVSWPIPVFLINSNLNMFHQTSYGFNAQPYTRTSFKY